MQIPNTPSPIASNVGPSAGASTALPGNAPACEAHPFAKMLSAHSVPQREEHATTAQPEAATADAPATGEAEDTAASASPSGPCAASRRSLAHAPRSGAARQATSTKPQAKTEAADQKDAARARVQGDDADATNTPPALAEFIAGLNRPVAPPASIAKAAPNTTTDILATGSAGAQALSAANPDFAASPTRAHHTPHTPSSAHPAPQASDAAKDAPGTADAAVPASASSESVTHASADASTLQATADKERIDLPTLDTPALRELHAAASVAGMQGGPRSDAPLASAALTATIATPATAPEFREALGVQVSVLARDGVQHAQLHLNPADMGPISVQIALDGTQARVDFGVDSSATRQIIESGLPELAAALRDAGFTLAGGGVSQHARQGSGQPGDNGARSDTRARGIDAGNEPASTRRVQLRLPQGAVDLYA